MIKDHDIIGIRPDGSKLTFAEFLENPYQVRTCRSFSKNGAFLIRVGRAFDPMIDASPATLEEMRREVH